MLHHIICCEILRLIHLSAHFAITIFVYRMKIALVQFGSFKIVQSTVGWVQF